MSFAMPRIRLNLRLRLLVERRCASRNWSRELLRRLRHGPRERLLRLGHCPRHARLRLLRRHGVRERWLRLREPR